MESVQPPAGSQVSRGQPAAPGVPTPAPAPAPAQVPAQRTPSEQLPPPPAAPTSQRPRRRVRTVLTVVAGVLALLCLGGGIAGYVLYDRVTTPDRSAPDVVVASYIQAFLNDRNDVKAEQFTCQDGDDLASMRNLRSELERREAKFDVIVRVSWGPLATAPSDDGQAVTTTLTIAGSANGVTRSSRREDWVFGVVEDDEGWRVCSGEKV